MNKQITNLDRANRVLTMLSRINRSIVRAESPDGLYENACRIAVECGLFSFAWIGLTDPRSGQLRVMSSYGVQGYPCDELAAPGGLADAARLSGDVRIYNDLASMPDAAESAGLLRHGLHAMAGLPLREDRQAIGVFALYAEQADCFDHTVIDLLIEVADDISFSLDHMLNEQRRLAGEAKIHYLAFYDAQTGLPNKTSLEQRLPLLAVRAEQRGTFLTLLDIRLQRLDKVVQILGGLATDEVMRTLARRIEKMCGNDGLLARMAPEEFVLVSLEMTHGTEIDAFAEQVQRLLEEPIRIGNKEVFLHAAIGGVMYPLHEHDIAYLLRRARAAADSSGIEGGFRVYRAEFDRGLEQRVEMEAELHRALERDEFQLHYQPQLNLKSGAMVGVEALLRWQHPQRGLISPAQFIPLLEECGLMPMVGAWVLRTACKQAKRWQDEGLDPMRMAVNLSAQQFGQHGLVETVRKALDDAGLEAEYLELELTESLILENAEHTIQTMHALKKLGVSLSLDDFGTGYSSLSYLRRYPVDRIKIDQSFIRDMTEHASSAALVRSILAMASNLGLNTIAEGVETAGQFGYLRKQLCQEMQGYLFSRPLPPEDMTKLLKEGRTLEANDEISEAGYTLLIVDDDPNVLSALKRTFRRESWQMLAAANVREALELLAAHDVGVIISDQRMPDVSGTEFLHRVKEMYPDTIRILLTGYADFSTVIDAVNRGDLYKVLSKPIEDDLLKDNVREAFRRYEIFAENRRLARRLEMLGEMQSVASDPQ